MQELQAGDVGSIPESGISPGGGHGSSLHIFAWRIPMDREAGRASVHGITKSHTRLKDLSSSSRYLREIMQYLCLHAQLFLQALLTPIVTLE